MAAIITALKITRDLYSAYVLHDYLVKATHKVKKIIRKLTMSDKEQLWERINVIGNRPKPSEDENLQKHFEQSRAELFWLLTNQLSNQPSIHFSSEDIAAITYRNLRISFVYEVGSGVQPGYSDPRYWRSMKPINDGKKNAMYHLGENVLYLRPYKDYCPTEHYVIDLHQVLKDMKQIQNVTTLLKHLEAPKNYQESWQEKMDRANVLLDKYAIATTHVFVPSTKEFPKQTDSLSNLKNSTESLQTLLLYAASGGIHHTKRIIKHLGLDRNRCLPPKQLAELLSSLDHQGLVAYLEKEHEVNFDWNIMQSLLQFAVEQNNVVLTKTLIDCGAKGWNRSVLEHAIRHHQTEILLELTRYGEVNSSMLAELIHSHPHIKEDPEIIKVLLALEMHDALAEMMMFELAKSKPLFPSPIHKQSIQTKLQFFKNLGIDINKINYLDIALKESTGNLLLMCLSEHSHFSFTQIPSTHHDQIMKFAVDTNNEELINFLAHHGAHFNQKTLQHSILNNQKTCPPYAAPDKKPTILGRLYTDYQHRKETLESVNCPGVKLNPFKIEHVSEIIRKNDLETLAKLMESPSFTKQCVFERNLGEKIARFAIEHNHQGILIHLQLAGMKIHLPGALGYAIAHQHHQALIPLVKDLFSSSKIIYLLEHQHEKYSHSTSKEWGSNLTPSEALYQGKQTRWQHWENFARQHPSEYQSMITKHLLLLKNQVNDLNTHIHFEKIKYAPSIDILKKKTSVFCPFENIQKQGFRHSEFEIPNAELFNSVVKEIYSLAFYPEQSSMLHSLPQDNLPFLSHRQIKALFNPSLKIDILEFSLCKLSPNDPDHDTLHTLQYDAGRATLIIYPENIRKQENNFAKDLADILQDIVRLSTFPWHELPLNYPEDRQTTLELTRTLLASIHQKIGPLPAIEKFSIKREYHKDNNDILPLRKLFSYASLAGTQAAETMIKHLGLWDPCYFYRNIADHDQYCISGKYVIRNTYAPLYSPTRCKELEFTSLAKEALRFAGISSTICSMGPYRLRTLNGYLRTDYSEIPNVHLFHAFINAGVNIAASASLLNFAIRQDPLFLDSILNQVIFEKDQRSYLREIDDFESGKSKSEAWFESFRFDINLLHHLDLIHHLDRDKINIFIKHGLKEPLLKTLAHCKYLLVNKDPNFLKGRYSYDIEKIMLKLDFLLTLVDYQEFNRAPAQISGASRSENALVYLFRHISRLGNSISPPVISIQQTPLPPKALLFQSKSEHENAMNAQPSGHSNNTSDASALSLERQFPPLNEINIDGHRLHPIQYLIALLLVFKEEALDTALYLLARGDRNKLIEWRRQLIMLMEQDQVKLTVDLAQLAESVLLPKDAKLHALYVRQSYEFIKQKGNLTFNDIVYFLAANMDYLEFSFQYLSLSGAVRMSQKMTQGYESGGIKGALHGLFTGSLNLIPGSRIILDSLAKQEAQFKKLERPEMQESLHRREQSLQKLKRRREIEKEVERVIRL